MTYVHESYRGGYYSMQQVERHLARLVRQGMYTIGEDGGTPPDASAEGGMAELLPRNEPPGLGGMALRLYDADKQLATV